ncbi:hypothetical protein Tsubulata_032136 [Turnera subulata]|uniref:Pentacotripeptide-repeat region of PRORP domain-containing protein n=1 Tax=Turnera subulata TaxID=218843 RepID=A0A9Q0F2J9_9ROSI|nr:hypothetical protein Tsubulata_032136 [Turnera subulata]
MLRLRYPLPLVPLQWNPLNNSSNSKSSVVVCATKGPRPRYPRVWKTNRKIGTISKSNKFVECVKGLSNVKEEVYGALDSFIAWDLEFPLITVKKALKTLEYQKEWKRVIQVAKWMLSKGQGKTMGTYVTLLNALAEDGRIEEVEEIWTKLFSDFLEGMPRYVFDKMISIYYSRAMNDKILEIFADMEELGVRPNLSIVNMVGDVFLRMGMLDKYKKLKRKYPPPKWIYRYIKGKRVRMLAKQDTGVDSANAGVGQDEDISRDSNELSEEGNAKSDEISVQVDNTS